MKPNVIRAKRHLQKTREIIAKRKSPFLGMKEEDVIDKIRRGRESIWEEKLASRS